jgi:protein-tyrosine phosphatase
MTMDRHIALQGAVNFRDLGGYEAADGLRTRWRVLFRADGLSELTEDDLDLVRQLGIRTVVDLRSGNEVEQNRFNVEAHPVSFHHFPFIHELPDVDNWKYRPGLLGSQYKEMLDEAGEQIVGAITVLAAPDARPAVFHCTAGKDRTGLLSAVVLSLLGVPEDTVVADYALSQLAMDGLRLKLQAMYPDSETLLGEMPEVFSADPANMVGLFEHLREHYGTIEGYAAAIGLPGDVLAALRTGLLEAAES